MNYESFIKIVFTGIIAVLVCTLTGITLLYTYAALSENSSSYASDGQCSIARISLRGTITTLQNYQDIVDNEYVANPDYIVQALREAETDTSIRGVVLEIDSYGGGPVASLLIAEQLMRMKKPTVALIREAGVSGGYIAALGARHIVASPLSTIGSIAITASYTDTTEKNKKDGLQFIELATGKYKDTGNPNKPLSHIEQKLMLAELQENHAYLVNFLSQRRSINPSRSAELADGSTYSAPRAQKEKLIDAIGSIETAQEIIASQTHEAETLCF